MTEPAALNPGDYELTGPELQAAFDTWIRPDLEGPSHAVPTIVCVTGPMASGKTTTMSAAPAMFGVEDACQIDADDYAVAHPAFLSLREQYGDAIARTSVSRTIGKLADKALEFVRDQRRNVIISGPMTDPKWFASRYQPLRDDGFTVQVVAVAVHPARSLLSMVDRFHERETVPGHGVWFDPAWHDRQVAGARDTLEAIERDGLADGLRIAERGGRIVYTNRLTRQDPVEWENPPRAVETLDAIRSRPWTDQEHAHHHDRALQLIVSPVLDAEKKLVVADAIGRSVEPNELAIAELSANAQGVPGRAAERIRYSTELRAAAQRWSADAPAWHERPYGDVQGEQLDVMFGAAEQRFSAALNDAQALRNQLDAPGDQSRPGDSAMRADQHDQVERLQDQAAAAAAEAKAVHGEYVIRMSLDPDRAATEAVERAHQHHHGPPASLDPEAAQAVRLLAEQQGSTVASRPGSPSTGSSAPPAHQPQRAPNRPLPSHDSDAGR